MPNEVPYGGEEYLRSMVAQLDNDQLAVIRQFVHEEVQKRAADLYAKSIEQYGLTGADQIHIEHEVVLKRYNKMRDKLIALNGKMEDTPNNRPAVVHLVAKRLLTFAEDLQ